MSVYNSYWGAVVHQEPEGGREDGRGGAGRGWGECKGYAVDLRYENVIARAL